MIARVASRGTKFEVYLEDDPTKLVGKTPVHRQAWTRNSGRFVPIEADDRLDELGYRRTGEWRVETFSDGKYVAIARAELHPGGPRRVRQMKELMELASAADVYLDTVFCRLCGAPESDHWPHCRPDADERREASRQRLRQGVTVLSLLDVDREDPS